MAPSTTSPTAGHQCNGGGSVHSGGGDNTGENFAHAA